LLQIIEAVLPKLQNGLSQNSPQSAASSVFTVSVMAVVRSGSALKRKQRLLLGTFANYSYAYNARFSSVTYFL
jgi:hypothetical protein